MELRHLRTFLAVADTLNISEAARRINVTQPALSRHIRELEHSVGHTLFVRHPKGLRLTESGAALAANGRKAVAAVDDALQAARDEGEKKAACLRVGYYSNICIWANILGSAFEKLGRKFPQATTTLVEASSAHLVTEVGKGLLDLALVGPGDYPPVPGMEIKMACSVPAMVMMPFNHRLAKKRQLSLGDLRDEKIVGLTAESSPGRDRSFVAACEAAGFSPAIAYEASGVPELMVAAKKRMGVAILDAFAQIAPLPGMAIIPFKAPGVRLDIHAVYAAQAAPAARLLVELTIAEARRAAEML